ncbi:MAG: oligosaccharide flippase family protein, partial [Elusimicrobia bacterium]|nr:oligosaccharide flippase family protein [Elusimicrobiota bacterium]
DWVRIARALPRTETPELRRRRIEMARAHSCEAEFRRFAASLTGARARRNENAAPGLDAVMLSPVPWSRAPQARRTEAADWAASGRRVFFVELGGERGWTRRLRRALFGPGRAEVGSLPSGVELVPALFLPASRRLFREANAALLAPRLVDLLHDRGLGETFAAVRNGPSPHSAAFLDKLRPALVLSAESDSPRSAELMAAARAAHPRAESPAEAERLPAFLSGLGWIGILYGFAKVSIFLTQMIAGRWLGPAEYGRANLALAAAAYLQIIPMLGFPTAMGKYLASETEEEARGRFVSTALAAFAVWMLLCLPLLIVAHRALAGLLQLPAGIFVPALFLAVANAVYVVVASPLLGLKRFAHRGLVETAYGLSAPLALLTAVYLFGPTYEAMIGALGTAFLIGAFYALWCQRRYLIPAFEPKVLETVWRYAAVASLNLLAVAFVLAPARFILHARRGPEEVGLFSAYFTATIQIALALLYMLQSVIVPMASDPRGQQETWELIKRRALPTLLGAWLIFIIGLIGALAIFGRKYPLRWDWAFAFSAAAALALAHGTLSALYSARDFSGLRISVGGGLLTGFLNAALAAALIPRHGVSGAAAALVAGFAAGLVFFVAARRLERA